MDLHYREFGSGPALLLLHGLTLDHRMWADHVPVLASRYRVITPDLPGHGRSEGATEPWCDLIARLLDHLGLEAAALCGLSLGGAVAVSFALHYPKRCAALIPVDAALAGYPFSAWAGPGPYAKQARAEGLAAALDAWLADPLLAQAMASPAGERVRAIVRAFPGTPWLTKQPSPYPPGPPEAERLGEIGAPTLVVVGEHDLADFQAIAGHLAGSIPGARKAVIPGAGHLVPFEQPALFQQTLLPFLDEHWGA